MPAIKVPAKAIVMSTEPGKARRTRLFLLQPERQQLLRKKARALVKGAESQALGGVAVSNSGRSGQSAMNRREGCAAAAPAQSEATVSRCQGSAS